jgi:hypothetical protein
MDMLEILAEFESNRSLAMAMAMAMSHFFVPDLPNPMAELDPLCTNAPQNEASKLSREGSSDNFGHFHSAWFNHGFIKSTVRNRVIVHIT